MKNSISEKPVRKSHNSFIILKIKEREKSVFDLK